MNVKVIKTDGSEQNYSNIHGFHMSGQGGESVIIEETPDSSGFMVKNVRFVHIYEEK